MEVHSINLSDFMSTDEIADLHDAINKKECQCGYAEDEKAQKVVPPTYVENYMGESHGWICPRCKKFVQFG